MANAFGKSKLSGFEAKRLMAMQEPLLVRVERLVGGERHPVDLPAKENLAPGIGWTKEEVLSLQQAVLSLTGGGSFEAAVTGADGGEMSWRFAYDSRAFPPRVPPTIAELAVGQPQAFGQQNQGGWAPGAWSPAGWGQPQGGVFAQQQPARADLHVVGGSSPYGGGGFQSDRFSRLEEQLQAERQARLEERHRADMDRQATVHAQEIAAMRTEIAKLADVGRRPAEDEQVRVLREELAKEREERHRTEERLERERAEERHRAELAALNAKIDQATQAMTAVAQARPDPVIEFMRENARQQADVTREVARGNEAQLARVSALTMQPTQVLDLIDRKGHGADELMRNMVGAYNGLFDMFRKAMELQGGGPEHPAVGILKDTVAGATEVAKRFLKARENEAAMKAQGEAVKAQAGAQAQIAQAQIAAQMAGGLNGAAAQAPAPAPEPPKSAGPPGAPTDEEMLGPALDQVKRLRIAIRQGMGPEDVASRIMMGVQALESKKLAVPAFLLLRDGRVVDFVEALIGEAPGALKDAVAQLLAGVGKAEEPEDDDPDDEDEDDKDGDEDEDEEEKTAR